MTDKYVKIKFVLFYNIGNKSFTGVQSTFIWGFAFKGSILCFNRCNEGWITKIIYRSNEFIF